MRNWSKWNAPEARKQRSESARRAAIARWDRVHADGESVDSIVERAKHAPRHVRITIEGHGPRVTLDLARSERHCRQYVCDGDLRGIYSATAIGRAIGRLITIG
jgi:hypothetical protein